MFITWKTSLVIEFYVILYDFLSSTFLKLFDCTCSSFIVIDSFLQNFAFLASFCGNYTGPAVQYNFSYPKVYKLRQTLLFTETLFIEINFQSLIIYRFLLLRRYGFSWIDYLISSSRPGGVTGSKLKSKFLLFHSINEYRCQYDRSFRERNYFFQSKDVGKIASLAQLAARQSHNQTRFFFYQSHATSCKIA